MTIDVNQQLYDQRRATIDSGAVTRNDDGRWVYADKAEVFGREGLDMTSGQAALYSSVPAWHGLGQIIPGGTSDIDEVLRLGRIDWEVEKRQVRYSFANDTGDVVLNTAPDHFVTVRTDTGGAVGVVGRRYEVIQNRTLFGFLADLVNQHGVIWESAGALRDGKRVFVSMRLPESVTVDAEGINDEIIPFLVAINSHDGSSLAQTVVTPWRPVCSNTERLALRDAHTRWGIRHTAGALGELDEARRTLGLTVKYYETFAAEETTLARTDIAVDEFRKVIDDLWPVETDATQRTKNAAERRRGMLLGMFESEAERAGRTAYAAERTITDYLDHLVPRRPGKTMTEEIARATITLEGGDDDIKNRAHRRLMTLVRH